MQDIIYSTILWVKVPHPKQQLMMDELECSSRTVVDWCNFCREVCSTWAERQDFHIGGVGKTVEIDESKIGKRKYNRGRRVEGQWVFGGVERESSKYNIIIYVCFFLNFTLFFRESICLASSK